MKPKFTLITGFILLLSVGFWPLKSQADNPVEKEKITLLSAIEQISQKYDVYFTFDMTLISEVKIVYEHEEYATAEEAVSSILRGTDLKYKFYDQRFVILYKKGEEGLESLKKMSEHLDGLIGEEERIITSTLKREIRALPILSSRLLSREIQRIAFTAEGKVVDQEGEPLIGVNIQIKGSNKGTATDFDGNFILEDINENDILVVSYVGYQTQEISVNGRSSIEILMIADSKLLDEVVVIGYSSQARRDITSSISTINSDKIIESSNTDISERLQGRISGVTIVGSHTPGAEATINIRGIGTINDSKPLWIIDGIPAAGPIPSNEIESISILKDAASQAIYGARASNGVILVQTKSGKVNQPTKIHFEVKNGFKWNSNHYDLLNSEEYGELLWLEAKNSGISNFSHPQYGSGDVPVIPNYIIPAGSSTADFSLYDDKMIHQDGTDTYLITEANKSGTDWLRESEQTGIFREVLLDINGGNEKSFYSLMMGYTKDGGMLKLTGYDRGSIRSNFVVNPTDWLQVGEKIGVSFSQRKGYLVDNSETSLISQAYMMHPIIPVYDIMGNYAGTRALGTGTYHNPVFLLDSRKDDFTNTLRINGNIFASVSLFPGFKIRSVLGIDRASIESRSIDFLEIGYNQRANYDALSESSRYEMAYTWTNTVEYSRSIGNLHDVGFVGGYEITNSFNNWTQASRQEFLSKDVNYIQLSTGLRSINNGGSSDSWSIISQFARINYTLLGKYFIDGVVRRDGSSRFNVNNRYSIFPGVSFGWNISDESFLRDISSVLTELKVRGGVGAVGNDRIGNYNSFTIFGMDYNNSFYPIDGAQNTVGATGLYQVSLSGPDVKWETTVSNSFGLDIELYNKLYLGIDIWSRKTNNMLFAQQLPMVLGKAAPPSVNVGTMINKGFDIEVNFDNTFKNGLIKYNIGLIFSHYKNEILQLSDNDNEFLTGTDFRNLSYTRSMKGTEFPSFYGYIVDGIFQTEAEAEAHPAAFGSGGTYNMIGRYKYRDVNGDGVIDSEDRTFIGSPHPKFTSGLNVGFEIKKFKVSSLLYSSYGNKMVNMARRYFDFVLFQGNRSHDRLYNSWGSPYLKDNSKAKLPIAETDDTPSQEPSTAFVEDASYLRMKHLRVDFNVGSLSKKYSLDFGVYASMSNVFTITKYSGLDPEVGGLSGVNYGIDAGAWPTPRQLLFGIIFDF